MRKDHKRRWYVLVPKDYKRAIITVVQTESVDAWGVSGVSGYWFLAGGKRFDCLDWFGPVAYHEINNAYAEWQAAHESERAQ